MRILNGDAAADRGGTLDVLKQMHRTKVIHYLPVLLLSVVGSAIAMPYLPNVLTNFFASRSAQEDLQCELFTHKTAPTACVEAHGEAALWQSWSSFLSSSVVSFFASPILGAASDKYGRKPFIVLSTVMQILPMLMIVSYSQLHTSLLWYFPVHAICGGMSGMSFYLAAVADALPAQNRSIGFGMVLAFASLGFILGPMLGAFMPNMDVAFSATIGVLLLGILYAVLVLEDTLPPQTTEEEEDEVDLNSVEAPAEMEGPNAITHKKRRPSAWKKVFESVTMISILNRTPLFRRLSLLIVCSSMCSGGLQEFLFQYLQMVLDFQTQDQAMLLVILGGGGVFVQFVLLGPIMKALGESRTLCFGLMVQIVYYLGLVIALNKVQVFATIALGSLSMVTFPSISSLKANNVKASEQGKIQGAIVGIQSLAMGIGPLAFSGLFAFFTRTDSKYYYPQAPFLFGVFLLMISLAVAVSVCKLVDISDDDKQTDDPINVPLLSSPELTAAPASSALNGP